MFGLHLRFVVRGAKRIVPPPVEASDRAKKVNQKNRCGELSCRTNRPPRLCLYTAARPNWFRANLEIADCGSDAGSPIAPDFNR